MASDISTLDIKEIIRLLPHRYPFILVDRILEGREREKHGRIEKCQHE